MGFCDAPMAALAAEAKDEDHALLESVEFHLNDP
jgi:hypothetical protein